MPTRPSLIPEESPGPAIGDIAAHTSRDITVPTSSTDIDLRCQNDCFGGIAFGAAACSMTEWTFDSANIGGQHDYDISNIQGFSVPQQIIPDSGCSVVTCTSEGCPCNQAYRPGDISGTCGGTGPVDQASRVCGTSGYTVVLGFDPQFALDTAHKPHRSDLPSARGVAVAE
ncbi:hypothetical protein DFH09DRAFT_1091051 [Mycena vulgaris]|nr:hypothetical protein DFH09DRAFT_1091051 [Mycena vulgaris]